jgi:two-component system chemotaxis response regulator CheY
VSRLDDIFPVLQRRTIGRLNRNIDPVRRELWHAFQRGGLSEEEFVSSLDRLEVATPVLGAHPGFAVAALSGEHDMSSTGPKCVLIVDDDETIRALIGEVLKLGGYRVEMAEGGLQALAKMKTIRPDAIVLDLRMPVMDGWAFLDQYRTAPLCGEAPVVVMSASPELQEATSALHDVQGVLAKPFDMYELLDTIEHVLQSPSEQASSVVFSASQSEFE